MSNLDFIVGNITFTEEGVVIKKAYSNDMSEVGVVSEDKRLAALKCALDYLQGRLTHCKKQLEENIVRAVVTPVAVYWKGGHFSIPVYQHIDIVLSNPPTSWDAVTPETAQQMVRALHFNKAENWYDCETKDLAFNIASEIMLCGIRSIC
jgi:hypothetical protein